MAMNETYVLLGVGGSGMSSLAHILLDRGENVFGYDKKDSKQKDALKARGLEIFTTLSDCLDNIPSNSTLVYSTAISIDSLNHPSKEFQIMHRSALLHKLFSEKKAISIAGSHGKTTTTAMVAGVLMDHNLSPSIMVGGDVPLLDYKGGLWGKGNYAVYESDESDGTFLNHSADYRIITNIDDDHLDHYKEKKYLLHAFEEYASQSDFYKTILYLGDKGIREIIPNLNNDENIILVGQKSDFESIAQNLINQKENSKFNLDKFYKIYQIEINDSSGIFYIGNKSYEYRIPFLGEHYLINASLAIALCVELGLDIESIIHSLANYKGVKRRLEILGNYQQTKILDDYGHHPTEVKAVISSLQKEKTKNNFVKTIVLFQPHRFTRTELFCKEFAEALSLSDEIYLLPIYSAGEIAKDGISSELIQAELSKLGRNSRILNGGIEEDAKFLRSILKNKNILVTLGAGDVWKWGIEILKSN